MQKHAAMLRTGPTMDERDLERAMLRKSAAALAVEAHRCADCGRTPLIGETLYRFAAAESVCELCRPLRGGDPESSARVRSSEYGHAVRIHRLSTA